ncbi:hypothetical protein Bhyg_05732 [Pseudolycoriella hygida]|uniref:Uncharacterized protein n=1 Tax=Pseudolycoriella hygida TaxID=35572 RepID=A0A9Q0S294_9DIPT|nr:hypothetical protein Bhyg_05732 [Pseudolycoriella hygida]
MAICSKSISTTEAKMKKLYSINKQWHIPRASLGGSTSSQSGSQISRSISSSVKYPGRYGGYKNRGYHSEGNDSTADQDRKKRKTAANCRKIRDIDKNPAGMADETNDGSKRGSQSSQGSTDSNHSSHSASSGSLLLTAANLEQLAQIHKKTPLTHHHFHTNDYPLQQKQQQHRLYNANITLNATDATSRLPMHRINEDAIVSIGIDANQMKTKDLDTMSMASSTHFTVVNGMGGPQRVTKDGLCSRGHQITVLILTMSLMFLIGISAAVFMLEMRAKKMPH